MELHLTVSQSPFWGVVWIVTDRDHRCWQRLAACEETTATNVRRYPAWAYQSVVGQAGLGHPRSEYDLVVGIEKLGLSLDQASHQLFGTLFQTRHPTAVTCETHVRQFEVRGWSCAQGHLGGRAD